MARPSRPTPRHERKPPRKNEKENKPKRSPMTRLLGAIDIASEGAEVIDAVYEALPEDVKRRWSKGRNKRGLVDTAGQYGIDGADWKLQALWHNWQKLDGAAAVENILKNELQDKVYGAFHKHAPRNTGGALNNSSKFFEEHIGSKIWG